MAITSFRYRNSDTASGCQGANYGLFCVQSTAPLQFTNIKLRIKLSFDSATLKIRLTQTFHFGKKNSCSCMPLVGQYQLM